MPVRLIDTSQASIDKGLKFADKLLAKDVSKGRLSQADADAARERISSSTKMEDLSDVDFVIEAVPVGIQNEQSRKRKLTTYRKFQT